MKLNVLKIQIRNFEIKILCSKSNLKNFLLRSLRCFFAETVFEATLSHRNIQNFWFHEREFSRNPSLLFQSLHISRYYYYYMQFRFLNYRNSHSSKCAVIGPYSFEMDSWITVAEMKKAIRLILTIWAANCKDEELKESIQTDELARDGLLLLYSVSSAARNCWWGMLFWQPFAHFLASIFHPF